MPFCLKSNNMHHTTRRSSDCLLAASRHACKSLQRLCLALCCLAVAGCEREPVLNLHQGGPDIELGIPEVDLDLNVVWNYLFNYDTEYNWQAEWIYGWDDTDQSLFGPIGYIAPSAFEVRRYFTGNVPFGTHASPYKHFVSGQHVRAKYDFGYWDILAWSNINTPDGVQNIRIDERSTYDYVTAYTGQTMNPSPYAAPQFPHSFYQPEELFAGYDRGIEINRNLNGFTFDEERNCWVRQLEMTLQPVTYIYLVQVLLRHNNRSGRKVTSIDGNANLSGMARSVNLNTGITGPDAVTVNFFMRMKHDLADKGGEKVDVIGGKALTFGIPKLNPSSLSTRHYLESLKKVGAADLNNRHYVDVKMQFYNGKDSTFVFDVTNSVRRLFRGGVITIELDMDKVPIPNRSGGSGFDAVVEDFEEKQWEFDM